MRLKMTDKKRLYEIIPDIKNISRSLKLAEQYGTVFEYNDFMLPGYLDDREECRRKLIFYKSLGRDCSNDTLHGAFIDISVHSEDSLIRKVSRFRVRQSMEIAQEMGVRGVVFHTGLLASFNDEKYRESWLEANVEFRFGIMGRLGGAVFLDTGNIWLLKNDPNRPGGVLKWRGFFNEIALGTGFGLRYDISYLVLRADLGIALHTPYPNPDKPGYYNISKFKDGLGFHVAIGYPF